jgi:hypothetical protein
LVTVVSLTLLRPKSAISKLNIFANSKPYAKKLKGPRESCLLKKPEVENLVTPSL